MSKYQKTTSDNDNGIVMTSGKLEGASRGVPYASYQTAGYISYLLDDLRMLAEESRMPFLAYLLHMAFEEAESQKQQKY